MSFLPKVLFAFPIGCKDQKSNLIILLNTRGHHIVES
jgi:hypothetical protein